MTPMLKMFEPTTLPMAMAPWPCAAAVELTISSGVLVPYATTVSPTSSGVTPSRTASDAPPRTSHSAPKYRATRPASSNNAISMRDRSDSGALWLNFPPGKPVRERPSHERVRSVRRARSPTLEMRRRQVEEKGQQTGRSFAHGPRPVSDGGHAPSVQESTNRLPRLLDAITSTRSTSGYDVARDRRSAASDRVGAAHAIAIDLVNRGASLYFTSNPIRRPRTNTSRSSSAPAGVAQK